MTAIWERSDLDQAETLVALALADHANDNGLCWPSIDRLAEKSRMSRRQTQRTIRQLEAKGVLFVDRSKTGRGHTSTYRLSKGDNQTPLPEQRVTSRAERVTSTTRKGDTAMSPESSRIIIEPKSDQKSLEEKAKAEEIRKRLVANMKRLSR